MKESSFFTGVMMVLNGAKDRIGKFLLGESGSISKKKIVGIGLISFVASAASAGNVIAGFSLKGGYDSDDNLAICKTSEGMIGLEGHGSGDIDGNDADGAKDAEAVIQMSAIIDLVWHGDGSCHDDLMAGCDDVSFLGYNSDYLREELFPDEFNCGEISDHISITAGMDNHWSDTTEGVAMPSIFLHNNDVHITAGGMSLIGEHEHDAAAVGGNTVQCHMSDHLSNHGKHNSNHGNDC